MVESLPLYRESTTDRRCVALQRSEHVKGSRVELRPLVPTMVARPVAELPNEEHVEGFAS
jgi:hypothetical protein